MSNGPRFMLIAGEVSGDMHAAGVVRAIKEKHPSASFFGIGGDAMRDAGVEVLHDVNDMAAIGFAEILPKLAFFRRTFYEMLDLARDRKPDAVILVDYPGFNLRFAARAHAMGLRVIYYICPQVWAWRKSRIPRMAEIIDRLLVIFPFEPEVFDNTHLRVDYVGHPLVDAVKLALAEPPIPMPWQGKPRIALLPGSRRQEVQRLLPSFLDAAAILRKSHAEASFVVATPNEGTAQLAHQLLAEGKQDATQVAIASGNTRHVLRQADAAIVASGTATLEAALIGCPSVIAYKMSPLSHLCLSKLVTLDHIGMVNIIAGRTVCRELVQNDATPQALAEAIDPLLNDASAARQRVMHGYAEVADKLGEGGSSVRAAKIILDEVSAHR